MALRSPAPFGCAAWRAGPGSFASARYQLPSRLIPSGSPGRMLWLWLQTSKVQSTTRPPATAPLTFMVMAGAAGAHLESPSPLHFFLPHAPPYEAARPVRAEGAAVGP